MTTDERADVATIESITSALGEEYRAVWVACEVTYSPTNGDEERYVRIEADNYDLALPFFVPRELVEAPRLEEETVVNGWVKVIHIEDHDDETTTVEVIGEPISLGPNIRIPRSLLR
jgi:hypothetical protein